MSAQGSSGSTVMRGTSLPFMPWPTSRMRLSTLETHASIAEVAILVVKSDEEVRVEGGSKKKEKKEASSSSTIS